MTLGKSARWITGPEVEAQARSRQFKFSHLPPASDTRASFHGVVGQCPLVSSGGCEPFQEVPVSRGMSWRRFAQRRHLQAQHIESEIKIAAKGALRHRLLQVAISGCENPHVDRNPLRASYGTDPLLNGP